MPSLRRLLAAIIGLSLQPSIFASESETPIILDALQVEATLVEQEQSWFKLEKEQKLTPGGVTLLDNTELNERNQSNLADMLRYVPGIWVASGSTGDSAFFSSRGSNLDATNYDGNGIKLLQDGLPVTAADGNNHNRQVDPLSTRYAIVARGANALTYGASTLGGAIDFISPTAHDTASQIHLNGGSHGQVQGQLTAGAVASQLDGLITLEARSWDGFREHQKQEREGLYANAGWQFSDAARTRLYLTYIDNDQELPGALTREQFEEDPYQAESAARTGNYQYNVESWRIANKTEWDLDEKSSLSLGFSYEEQALYHPIVFSPFFSLLIDTDQNTAGTALRYNVQLGDHDVLAGVNYGVTTVKGGNYSHEDGRRNDLMTRVDNRASSLEMFVVDRWQFAPQWNLIYGVQVVSADREVRNIDVANGDRYNPQGDYDSINPCLGVIYQLTPDSELFANLSRLYEPPTNYELEDDASPDDEALDAMRGEVVEVGTRGRKPFGDSAYWHWEIALYYAQLRNEILSVDDPNAPGTSLSTNVDDTVHAGLEVLLGSSFTLDAGAMHRLEPLVSLTVNEFSFDKDPLYGNNRLPVAPRYAVKSEIIYRNGNGFFVGPTFDFVDKRYADFSNTYTIGSYTLLGLRAGFTGPSWEIYGEARNLTDRDYVSVFSVKDIAAPDAAILQAGEPRSIYVGMRLYF